MGVPRPTPQGPFCIFRDTCFRKAAMPFRRPPARRFPTRRTSSGYAFVSYSSKDWDVVKKLLQALTADRVWVDKRNVELGDALPERIETGIAEAASLHSRAK